MIKGLKNDAYKRCQELLLFSQEEEKNDQGGLLNCYSGICIPGPGDRGLHLHLHPLASVHRGQLRSRRRRQEEISVFQMTDQPVLSDPD